MNYTDEVIEAYLILFSNSDSNEKAKKIVNDVVDAYEKTVSSK